MNYRVTLSKKFEASYKQVIKRYYRKNQQGLAECDKVVADLVRVLEVNPRNKPPIAKQVNNHIDRCLPEPWPSKLAKDGWEFWKAYFGFPALSGAANKGRVIYAIDEEAKVVHVIWIYNHQQFAKRPDDRDLQKALKEIVGEG
jgi:mRNA-degrading endonuclease RelE of RelBE toxin-antitoxin system